MPTKVLRSKIPAVVRDTWLVLKALAGDTGELSIEFGTLKKMTGKTRTTVLSHLTVLKSEFGVSHSTLGGTLKVDFSTEGTHESENSDSRISDRGESLIKTLNSQLEIKSSKLIDSAQSENSDSRIDATVKATTKQITDEYCRLLGYKPANWAAGEGKAAKEIGLRWTAAEMREAYQHYKAQQFWAGKRLWLRVLVNEMPEYFKAKAEGRLNGRAEPSNLRLPDGV